MDKKIVIATHYLVYGAPQALRDYLMNNKIRSLFFMAHPLEIDGSRSYIEIIRSGETKKIIKSKLRTKISILKYISEIFLNFKWTYSIKENIDLWVGVDSLNALCGIIIRELGKANKVVYYTIDYYPQRFENKVLNYVYYKLDKICVKYADETWNVSQKMVEAREKKCQMKELEFNRQKTVPIGIWFDRIKRKDISEINRKQTVFVGHLKKEMGIDLVVRAIPKIIEKIPDFEFLLIGGGDEYENLRKLVKDLGVESHVKMTNWVKDRIKLEELMLRSAVGLAPFNVNIVDEKFYNADPTKIKDYLVMGMPVILTPVPSNTKQLKDAGCALIIDYNEESLANAVISLLQNEKVLENYREKAVKYIRNYDWNLIFKNNLARIL